MARTKNPETVDRVVELTPEQMLAHRSAAINAALTHATRASAQTPLAELLHNAGVILYFLMQGEPVFDIQEHVSESQPLPVPLSQPLSVPLSPPPGPVASPKVEKVVAAATAAVTSAAKVAPSAPSPTPSASAPSSPAVVPAPTNVKAVADKLVALVQDKARGGRAAAEALLKKYGVSQLAQIPGAKLAEFAAECETFALAAADPTGGLLG